MSQLFLKYGTASMKSWRSRAAGSTLNSYRAGSGTYKSLPSCFPFWRISGGKSRRKSVQRKLLSTAYSLFLCSKELCLRNTWERSRELLWLEVIRRRLWLLSKYSMSLWSRPWRRVMRKMEKSNSSRRRGKKEERTSYLITSRGKTI